ncbi:MAG: ankyrin repeat domain-containing protein, partial [Hyphomicrobiaceae bacterium]
REIAEFLLDNGARLDIFAAAMLGHLDVEKTANTACPQAKTAPGAHGIPLLAHAKMGGEKALPVLEYLQSLG